MRVTKAKTGATRYGPFSNPNTLISYLHLCNLPVFVAIEDYRIMVITLSKDELNGITKFWKNLDKAVAYIEVVP
jgi:hypothetical protein